MRAFERALPLALGEKWRRHPPVLPRLLARSSFDRYVGDVGYEADSVLRAYEFDALKELGEWVTSQGGMRMSINIRNFFALADQIEPLLPRGQRILRRRLREIAKWAADPRAARNRHTSLEHRSI